MKNMLKNTLALVVVLCMLLSAFSVSALWDFSEGIPEGWERQNSLEMIKADHINEPVNPNATQEAKNLLAYLQIVGDSQQFLAGQFEIDNTDTMMDAIYKDYGYMPSLFSARYQVDTSEPKWEMDGDKETAVLAEDNKAMDFTNVEFVNTTMKKYYDMGAVLLVHSDSAPRELCAAAVLKNKPDMYYDATDAIWELDATNPDRDMQAYALWMRYQEHVIEGLQALEASGVKAYLWRPWIEYNNHVFAGKTDAGYDAFVRVYQQTVNMLIDAGLKGFLVTFSPNGFADILTHNPGTDYIDSYAFTMYSDSGRLGYMIGEYMSTNSYNAVKQSGKPLGFSEFSCRTGTWQKVGEQARASSFDLMRSALSYWPELSWVNYWGNGSYSSVNADGAALGNDDGMLYWSSDFALTLDEIVDYRNTTIRFPGVAQLFTTANASGDYVGLEEKDYTAADLAKLGLKASDVRALRLNRGFAVKFWTNADCTGDFYSYAFSTKNVAASIAKNFKSVTIIGLSNVALNQTEVYASVNDKDVWRINDGYLSMWQADVNAEDNVADKGTAWVRIDLGKAHHIGRYVLKNASYGSYAEMYNTADFQLQYSNNGVDWITVDSVTGNTLGQVDRSFDAVMGRYFRLLITKPNSTLNATELGAIAIAELELYGVDPGLLADLVKTEDMELEDGDGSDDYIGEDFDYTDEDYTGEENVGDTDIPSDEEGDEDGKPSKKPVQSVTTITYFPWWAWVLIAVGVLAVAGGIVLLLVLKKRKAADTTPEE